MPNIPHLIKMLESNNSNDRYDACEQLRVSTSIPQEAIDALRAVLNDANPDVADAAQRALALHERKLEPESIETEQSKKQQIENKSLLDSALKVVRSIFILLLICIGLSLLSFLFLPCGIFGC